MNFKRSAVWWPTDVDKAVSRGYSVLAFNSQFTATAQDWQKLHDQVTYYRNQGIDLWVIRYPAYLLTGDTYPASFDQKYKSHWLAQAIEDEGEDKQKHPVTGRALDWWTETDEIISLLVQQVNAYKAYMPDVPIFFNGNGTHITTPDQDGGRSQRLYTALSDAGVALFCQDNYLFTDDQIQTVATGQPSYPITYAWQGSNLIRQWTGKPCWVTIETGNQGDHKANDPAWGEPSVNPSRVFSGSRAPTPAEVQTMIANAPDGVLWFQEANGGATNDATDPLLEPVIKSYNVSMGATAVVQPAPSPVPQPIPAPPVVVAPTPAPPVVAPVVPPIADLEGSVLVANGKAYYLRSN